MSLRVDMLEEVKMARGKVIARCPACAEEGADAKGDHLVILESGKFGCGANPGDRKHRKRIFELVGDRESKETVLHLPIRKESASRRVTFRGIGTGATTSNPAKTAEKCQSGTFGTGNSNSLAGEVKQESIQCIRSSEEASQTSQRQPKPPYYRREIVGVGLPVRYVEDDAGECYLANGRYYYKPTSRSDTGSHRSLFPQQLAC